MPSLRRQGLSGKASPSRIVSRNRPLPRPSRLRRQPATPSPAAPDGGRGASATANRRSGFAKRKNARQNRAVFDSESLLSRRHSRLQIRWIDGLVEIGVQLVAVEFALPPGNEHRGDAVAGDVGERTNLAHELVHRKYDGDP